MNKIYIFIAIMVLVSSAVLSSPAFVLAQYNYNTPYVPIYGTQTYQYGMPYATSNIYGACTNITAVLYQGHSDVKTGGQVSALQSFLISRGYMTSAGPTGYFGPVTYQALLRYQYANGLPPTGTTDITTITSIRNISCGGSGYYGNYYVAPVIKSFSANSGYVGTSVTIYGSGFDFNNNTVNFDGVSLVGIPSYGGTALAFVVPQVYGQYNTSTYGYGYNLTRTYPVSVTNTRGTSNSLNFTVTSFGTDCRYDNYSYNYDSRYRDCYDNRNQPYLSSISPSSARVGREVTLYGSDFTSRNNTVYFGVGGEQNVSSSNNGTRIRFTIPSYISPCDVVTSGSYCALYAQKVIPGTYSIYVTNSNGQTNTLYFSVID